MPDPWEIALTKTAKNNLPQSVGMECGVLPRFPSMQLLVGKSGSGKSMLLAGLLNNPKLMGQFFDDIYLVSPTGKADDIVKGLGLADDHIWDDLPKAIKDLEILMDNQSYDIENLGIEEVSKKGKIMIIFDDCIGNKALMKSDILTKIAIHGRHALISSMICTQSYTKVPRVIRIQAQGLALFPSSQDEVKLLCDDYCPANCSKKKFSKIIEFATDEPYSYLYIQNHCKEMKDRFRKKIGNIINLSDF